MKPKFKIGDKVIEKEPCFGGYGYVTSVNHYNNPDCYVVKFANGDERVSYIEDFCVENSEIKAAFLTRLQELLATFDASIYDYEQYKLCIDLGCDEQIEWSWDGKSMKESYLTAENVFDYDKD